MTDLQNENREKYPKNKKLTVWNKRRELRTLAIALEVDLENREIIIKDDLKKKLNFEINTRNIDRFISNYVDPLDSKMLNEALQLAEKGQEKPFYFHFIHPGTEERLCMEFHYEIVYVRYASTRLNGVLVNVKNDDCLKNLQ